MVVSNLHQGVIAGAAGGTAFDTTLIPNSVWMDGSADGFTRSASDFDNEDGKEFTLGTWFQLTEFGVAGALFCAGTSGGYTSLRHDGDNKIYFQTQVGDAILSTPRLYRDIGWYHLLLSVDTTQAVSSNRVRLFINGEEVTLSGTQPAEDRVYQFNTNQIHEVGDSYENGAFEGYLAQSFMIGSKSIQQGDFDITDFLDTFTLGTNGSQFIPKKHSEIKTLVDAGSDNSFLLQYENSGALGTDSSTYTNTFTATSMAAANQSTNTPSLVYPIINAIDHSNDTLPTLSEGNLRSAGPGASRACLRTTLPIPTTGKWYWEAKWNSVASARIGFAESNSQLLSNCGQSALSWGIQNDGKLVNDNSEGSALFSWSTNDIIAMAYDADNSKFWFGRIASGTTSVTWASSGNPETGANATVSSVPTQITPALDTNTGDVSLFFPEEDWTLSSKLSGFKEINSKNLTAPDYQGIDYFDSTIYEGTGGGQRVGDFVPFTDAYNVSKSIIFNDNDSAYLEWNSYSGSPTSGTDCTFSFWAKRGNLGSTQCIIFGGDPSGSTYEMIRFESGDTFRVGQASSAYDLITTRVFKDTTQWYHFVVAFDTDNSTAADRIKIYVNGVRIEDSELGTSTDPSSGYVTNFNTGGSGEVIDIGFQGGGSNYFDGYLAQVVFIDGQALTPSSFGQTDTSTNRWIPKDVSGLTFGTNGYYLDMAIAPGTGNGPGNDVSGNNNDFTVTNLVAGDQSNDTPSNNHATLDSADTIGSATPTLSEGNLTYTGADNGGRYVSGFPLTSGKWYWELDVATAGAFYPGFFTPAGVAYSSTTPWTSNAGSFLVNGINGHWLGAHGDGTKILYSAASGASPSGGPGVFISNGDRMFFAFDADNKYAYIGEVGSGGSGSTLTYYTEGGTASADPTNGSGFGAAPFGLNLTGEDTFYFGAVSGGSSSSVNFLFDSTKWNGTPPTGYKALTQDNMDDTASKLTAWAWIKNRDATDDHILVDRVRGVGNVIHANSNAAQALEPNTVQRFLQRGVQIGNDVQVNTVNESYVLWQWLVGTSATTGTTTSPAGTIDSTTIVADAGHFSVGEYTTPAETAAVRTVGHGLGGALDMLFIKNQASGHWAVWHNALSNQYLRLNATDGATTGGTESNSLWNAVEPGTNTNTFTIGTNSDVNGNNVTFSFIAFRSIPGVCKVGSYTGNGNADGTYVSLGFKPRWIMYKLVGTESWEMYDTVRQVGNVYGTNLKANLSNAETDDTRLDILSDGFKARSSNSGVNTNGSTYAYIAMAEIGGNGTLPPIYGI